MEVNTIAALPREATGKRQVQKLRAEGYVPAVIYGREGAPESIQVSAYEIGREFAKHHRVFNLSVKGNEQAVFLQDVHWDALTDDALHIDFLRIDMNEPLALEVELVYLGIPKGQSKGGTLVKDLRSVKVHSMPSTIPHDIEVKVGDVDVGDVIRTKDLPLPEGVTLNCSEEMIVARMP